LKNNAKFCKIKYVTIYAYKKIKDNLLYFSVTKKFQKVKREMDFGHF